MLVDRNELEAQLFGNLEAVGFGHVEVADSKRHLQRASRPDRRGLIVSMIHKFDDIPADINTRENVFVLVDEAHRTTGGDLGNYLMGALPNATYIGFTGTPIDRTAYGKGTFKVFGADDRAGLPRQVLDPRVDRGRHDGAAPLRARPERAAGGPRRRWSASSSTWPRLEGVSDIEELNRVLERAVTLKNMLKNPDRVERVAEYVADHFRENVEPMGYKAFLVAVDREACALYKEALDKHLPPEYSRGRHQPRRTTTRRSCRSTTSPSDEEKRRPQGVPQARRRCRRS